jgi:hypothetical protein
MVLRLEEFAIQRFGNFLWESNLLWNSYYIQQDKESMRILHACLNPNHVHQPAMSYVIDEINAALQLEEGLKAEEGAMKIEIPSYASCGSIETLEEIEWPPIFNEKSTSDCSEIGQKPSTVALVNINPKGKRQQQPQTIFTQSHGSRSVFQIVLISQLMQEMTRGLIINNLCCEIV